IDVHRQIGIHLDNTAKVPFVPIVTAPRFIGNVFDAEVFVRRQLDVHECAFAARLNRELKHCPASLWESGTLAANSRNAARAIPHREASARAWRGFPGSVFPKT